MSEKKSVWMPFQLIVPAVAMLAVTPLMSELPPFYKADNLFQVLMPIPFYLGLMAAPGFVFYILNKPVRGNLSRLRQRWVGYSLIAAFFASLGGLPSILTVINIPFILGSVVITARVCWQFFKGNNR